MAIECDVLVVGAGPAGAAAARAAALNGAKVILLDKKGCAGKPVKCGEEIGAYLLDRLPFVIPPKMLKWHIHGLNMQYKDLAINYKNSDWNGYSINREDYDKWLSQEAIKFGAKIILNSEVKSLKSQESGQVKEVNICTNKTIRTIRSSVLIAADGASGNILKLLGRYDPKLTDIAEIYSWEAKGVTLPDPHIDRIYLGDMAPTGYAYVMPKSKDVANIGVAGIQSPLFNPEKKFEEFMNSAMIEPFVRYASLTLNKSKEEVWGNLTKEWAFQNILFCGDSANQNLKPFVEGILPSTICGDIAGILSIDMLKGELVTHKKYLTLVKSKLDPYYSYSQYVGPLLQKHLTSNNKKKYLIYLGIMAELFEKEVLDDLDKLSYSQIEKRLRNSIKNITSSE